MDQNSILAFSREQHKRAVYINIEVFDSSNILRAPFHIRDQIDELGRESADAQGLKVPITSAEKLLLSGCEQANGGTVCTLSFFGEVPAANNAPAALAVEMRSGWWVT